MTAAGDRPNRRVLVIDDNDAVIRDFRKILAPEVNDAGALSEAEAALFGEVDAGLAPAAFEVDSATQGEEGFRRAQQALQNRVPYAVAFVDMRMPPGWDGTETIARIWEQDPLLQVVICTAYSEYSWEDLRSRLVPGDRLLILKKPFDSVEVYQLASALCAKWEMTRQAQLKMGALEEAVEARTRALQDTNDTLQQEIARRESLQQQLESLSITDPLTGLSNRRRFDEALAVEWQRARRAQGSLAIAMIDVDYFKPYNDRYGHIAGDACLRLVAGTLAESCRQATDLVARYGGEEFVVILPGADHAVAGVVAERARDAVAALKRPHPEAAARMVTISVGVATMTASAEKAPEQLLGLADAALYEAKQQGRNRVVCLRGDQSSSDSPA